MAKSLADCRKWAKALTLKQRKACMADPDVKRQAKGLKTTVRKLCLKAEGNYETLMTAKCRMDKGTGMKVFYVLGLLGLAGLSAGYLYMRSKE